MKTVFFLIVFLFIPITGYAVTIHVPGDYSTIQKAIDAAGSGDMVLVSPGTYVENIDFMGKAITVKSSNGPDVTVIDGNKKSSVVTFSSGEGHDSVLDGFSITNGSGTYDGYDQCGGGIYCKDSSPTLKNLIVQNNRVDMSGGYANGGGIYCSNSTAVITSCNITNNMVGLWSGSGAGIYSFNSSLVVSNNVISGNQVLATGMGGGVFSDGQSDHISNNMVFENSSGAFDGNGGGMAIFGMADLRNNTVCDNQAPQGDGGGIHCNSGSSAMIVNSIVRGNKAEYSGPQIFGYPPLEHCNVEGGYPGLGNINQEPLFKNPSAGDYHLTWMSPCINRGTNIGAPSTDIDGEKRPFMGTVDMGADEFTGTHPLEADVFALSVSAKTPMNFKLNAGPGQAYKNYVLLGCWTGSTPGLTLPGGKPIMPINWDALTNYIFARLNLPIFTNFLGKLDSKGTASALFDPQGAVTGMVGLTFTFAYATFTPWDFASNPVNALIVK